MINKITKETYPDLWDKILEDVYDNTEMEHRKGSSFYTNYIFLIDEEFFPENPELHGFWMSETLIWDDYGGDDSDITELTRVEKKKIVIEKEKWCVVK
jgi:hypothetical protein